LRNSRVFLLFVLICLLTISFLAVDSGVSVSRFLQRGRDLNEITSALKLTDISFTNDARYTRQPSQADLFSAFQDYPGSIEHFPSGSVTPPPDFSLFGGPMKVRGR
jgi:hypothetical protein